MSDDHGLTLRCSRARELTREEIAHAGAFVRRVAGLPWREGANGPDAFDCWGLARATQAELFDRDIPVMSRDPADVLAVLKRVVQSDPEIGWVEVKNPAHGDLVTLRHVKEPQHIGTWLAIDRGRLLHAVANAGVCFDAKPMLTMTGWGRFRFYRYVGPTPPVAAGMQAAA